MIPLRVQLVTVPAAVWAAVPPDRPLADLAADLAGAARRATKDAAPAREVARMAQLAAYVEEVGLEAGRRWRAGEAAVAGVPLAGTAVLEWRDGDAGRADATAYLDLVERVAAAGAWPRPGRLAALRRFLAALGGRGEVGPAWAQLRLAWRGGAAAGPDAGAAARTVHAPGAAVAEQLALFESLTPVAVDALYPAADEAGRAAAARVAYQKAGVLRAAALAGAAVVEVVAAAPG